MRLSKSVRRIGGRPRRLLTTYLMSFLLIFLVPVLVLTGSWLTREWHEQRVAITTGQERTLTSVTSELNAMVDHMLVTTNQMALDAALAPADQDYLTYKDITNALARYDLSSTLIQKIFIYSRLTPDLLYATDGTYDLTPTLFKYGMMPEGPEMNRQIRSLLHTVTPMMLFTPTNGGQTGQLTFATPIIPAPGAAPRGMAFYVLNVDQIHQKLQDAADISDQAIALLVGQGRIVSSATLDGQILPLTNRTKDWQQFAGKAQFQMSRTTGNGNLFQVVSLTAPGSSWPAILMMLRRYAWLFIALLAAGALLSWHLSRRQYRGIRELAAVVPQTDTAIIASRSELDNLQRAIQLYVANHQEIVAKEKIRLPFVRNQVLQMIISGRVNDSMTIHRLLGLAQLAFAHSHYAVGIMTDLAALDDQMLATPVVGNDYTVYFAHRTSHAEVIVLVNYGTAINPADILGVVRDELSPASLAPLFAGQPVAALELLHEAYIEAVTAQMTNLPGADEKVSFYQKRVAADDEGLFDVDNELKLANSLAQGNAAMAQEAFEALFNHASQSYRPEAAVDLPVANLISQILKADYRQHQQVDEAYVQKLLSAASFNELHGLLLEIIQKMTAPQEDDTFSSMDMETAIRSFIAANACSPLLSLVDVAEQFHLSVSYASHFVKETTGEKFTTFVTDLRMERIRIGLVYTDAPIKEIVTANGYYDVANFTRKFKQINGVTPSQYRRLHQVSELAESN